MNAKIVMSVGLALALAACVSTPQPNAALQSAQAAVRAAEMDPNVSKYAAVDLEGAKQQLGVAEAAAMHHETATVEQSSYMAAQTARLAQEHAAAKADEARVAAGQAERDKIQLAARTREVDTAVGQRDQATDKADRLQAEMDALKATPTPRGLVLTLGDVLFETGKAQLSPGSARKLDQLAQFLTEHPQRRVEVDGFTDNVGSDSYNQELSQQRADAVKSALVGRGIDRSRIQSEGYGKGFPVAGNSESSGRQLNRRVEVVIGEDSGAAIPTRS